MIFALSIASLLAAPHSMPVQTPVSHADIAREIFARKPCSDHSIISDRAKATLLDRRCKEADTEANMKVIQGLDGKREARLALARADYRLGAVWPDFPPRPGNMPWETPGVSCPKARVGDVIVFSSSTDTASAVRQDFEVSVWSFLTDYNTTLISSPKFPRGLLCLSKLAKGS